MSQQSKIATASVTWYGPDASKKADKKEEEKKESPKK